MWVSVGLRLEALCYLNGNIVGRCHIQAQGATLVIVIFFGYALVLCTYTKTCGKVCTGEQMRGNSRGFAALLDLRLDLRVRPRNTKEYASEIKVG